MTTRAQRVRLGIFMLLAFVILLGSVGTLAGLKMWNPKDRYSVRFRQSVSGLESGSTVKMKGVRVGQVERIKIDPQDVETVVVTLSLDPGTPVKKDTQAVMTAIGITGLQFVELTGGSARAALLQPNKSTSLIPPGESALQSLTGKATDIAKKMEAVLNNVLDMTKEGDRTRIRKLIESIDGLAVAYTELVSGEVPKRVRRILVNVDRTTSSFEKAASTFNKVTKDNSERIGAMLSAGERAANSLARAVQNLKPQATLTEINETARALRKRIEDPSIERAINALGRTAMRVNKLSSELSIVVRGRDRQLSSILANIDRASADLKSFARSIKERPSLLLRGDTRKERSVP